MARNRPGAKNIIAIILGASTFPNYKTLDDSDAFSDSAAAFEEYLRTKLSLPDSHILPLFNSEQQPGQQLGRIRAFLRQRLSENNELSEVIIYYCGHGAYLAEDEYVLALKCTDVESKEATVFKVSYLVDIVADLTREKRNLVILDACYSGAALSQFINMSEQDATTTVTKQFYDAAPNPEESDADAPDEPGGAILFCAAGPKKWAKTPLEGTYTMFSGALTAALDEGDPKGGPDLTVKRLAQLVDAKIRRSFGTQAVKPQVHVPIQGDSDLLESPFFPNPAFGTPLVDDRLKKVEVSLDEIRKSIASLSSSVRSLESRPRVRAMSTADPTVTGFSLSAVSTLERLFPFLRTLLVCLIIDSVTYFALKSIAPEAGYPFFKFSLAVIAISHALIAAGACIAALGQREVGSRAFWIFNQLLPGVSCIGISLNSVVATGVVLWIGTLPPQQIPMLFGGANLEAQTSRLATEGPSEAAPATNDLLQPLRVPNNAAAPLPKDTSPLGEKDPFDTSSVLTDPQPVRNNAAALLPKDISSIQNALCVPQTGILDSQTQVAIRSFLQGRQLPAGADITARTLDLLRGTIDATPDCKAAGFRNAYEVGYFTGPGGIQRQKIRQIQLSDALSGPTTRLTPTGNLDAETRAAINRYRKSNALPSGDFVDRILLARLAL
jgi:hypothetical protein